MLKWLFSWDYSGLAVVAFHGVGAALWGAGLFVDPYKPLFVGAEILLLAAFIWSLKWLWTHDVFQRSRTRYARRYSDRYSNPHSDLYSHDYLKTHPERRRSKPRRKKSRKTKNRKLRWVAVFTATAVFIAATLQLLTSYRDYVADKELGKVEVYLSGADNERTKAKQAQVMGGSNYAKDMMFALIGIPTHEVALHDEDERMKVNVIVKNTGEVDIRNAHIKIDSNVPIQAGAAGLVSLSETELSADAGNIQPFRNSGKELVFSVVMAVPSYEKRSGLYVTIQGDRLPAYSAAARVLPVRLVEPDHLPGAAPSLPPTQHPSASR